MRSDGTRPNPHSKPFLALARLAAAVVLGGLCACTTPLQPTQVKDMLQRSVTSAEKLLDDGRPIEAAQLVRAASRVDPEFPGISNLDERLLSSDAATSDLFAANALGSNRLRRLPIERSPGMKALLYIPDRILDLLDVYTIELHGGPGVYLDFHVTRALQIAGGARAILGVGTYSNHTILGGRAHANAGLTVLPLGVQAQGGGLASAGGIRTGYQTLAGVHRPTDEYYQEYEDYWSEGISLTIGYVGITIEGHFVQAADFLAGFVGVDFLNDDFAYTTALSLSPEEETLILDLSRAVRSEETMNAYKATLGDRAPE